MKKLNRPRSIQISNQKRLSNIKLSSDNSFAHNKISINPLLQSIKNSPISLFSPKINQNQKSFLNITDKKFKTKNYFFETSEKHFIKAINSPKKEKDKDKSDIKKKLNDSHKNPICLQKSGQNLIKFIQNYPKTFYQKLSNSIQKMKIQTDKTLKVMRKNIKISSREAIHRATSAINIHHNFIKKKEKGKKSKKEDQDPLNLNNYDEYTNLNHSITKNKYLMKSNKASYLSNNFITNNNSKENNFSDKNNNSNELLGLSRIPSISFRNIKDEPFYIPLFKNFEKNRKFYKNMYHFRSFEMNDKILLRSTNKIYGMPNILVGLSSYIKEPEIQLKFIYNKIKILLDNIKYFKLNYMLKKDFRLAFINMENPIKAEFNYIIEELCVVLIRIIPQLLKGFYNSLDQLLFINIPGIDEEMKKKPSNEIECLKYNINFFNKVSDYFAACVDIYNVIQKQIAEFRYKSTEFHPLNKNLDLARFDSSKLISMSDSYIEKTKNDENIFSKLEIGLNLKKKKTEEKEEEDEFERYHKRRRIKIVADSIKIDRINSALNIGKKEINQDIIICDIKKKNKKLKIHKNPSILNSSLIKDMMKYFNKNIKAKIISQQVIERFKNNELKRLNNNNIDDRTNSINEII